MKKTKPVDAALAVVPAEVHTDDYVAGADFDAEKWMKQATDQEILDLAACEWGGDYPADGVAEWMEGEDENVRAVFTYKHEINRFKTMGFECHVDEEAALKWLKQNKPSLFERIQKENQ